MIDVVDFELILISFYLICGFNIQKLWVYTSVYTVNTKQNKQHINENLQYTVYTIQVCFVSFKKVNNFS